MSKFNLKNELKRMVLKTTVGQKHNIKRVNYANKKNGEFSNCVFVTKKKNKVLQYDEMLKKIDIKIQPDRILQHWIDEDVLIYNEFGVLGNTPPDYSLLINNSLETLIEMYNSQDNEICRQNVHLLIAVKNYCKRIINKISDIEDNKNLKRSKQLFESMINEEAKTLEDALQRILLWSSILWQSGHKLVGLGRLDVILDKFLKEEEENDLCELIDQFLINLHDYYSFKSAALPGDIGQIIILGGKLENGEYFCNALTYKFIERLMALNYPDPKVLLRVSDSMPNKLLEVSLKSIVSGIGSPLLSNDDVIIPQLLEFGYKKEEACNYVTSACWEPSIYGESMGQNNVATINFAQVLAELICSDQFMSAQKFDDIIKIYLMQLEKHINVLLQQTQELKWEEDPIYTLLTKGCILKEKDIADGGAINNDMGILSVGLSNAIDSLINIRYFVFKEHKYTLKYLNEIWNQNDTQKQRKIFESLDNEEHKFGADDESVISLTNVIIDKVSSSIKNYKNRFGGHMKFGLSSPGYIMQGEITQATFDGRLKGQPLGVHISSQENIPVTAILNFASKIKYCFNMSNGNVVDFIVAPEMIQDNFEKFVALLRVCIQMGIYQLQINVVSSKVLIEAQKEPEKFPNLIVRVWGFSAYFKDLPIEYQNILIHRALQSEAGGI